jgi:hypothetical protein
MDETQQEELEEQVQVSTYWWVRQIILVAIAGFYLVFGIQLLISAYQLNDPTSFIFTFYASNSGHESINASSLRAGMMAENFIAKSEC